MLGALTRRPTRWPSPDAHAFITSGGAAAAVAAAAGVGFAAGQDGGDDGTPDAGDHVVPFYGEHQSGIATPAQDRLHFAAFDVEPGVRAADLRDLLQGLDRRRPRR